jgi:hypothetical protein
MIVRVGTAVLDLVLVQLLHSTSTTKDPDYRYSDALGTTSS